MRVVWLDVPQAVLDDRRRAGLSKADEMWDGVLALVPPHDARHVRLRQAMMPPCGTAWSDVLGLTLQPVDGKLRITGQRLRRNLTGTTGIGW
ncbi:hypothetical protein [Pseudonocardia sp. TRM90224]|uniref:hypothetical protein n=1 Tax=Pseudonocardia sp. TRM90224 TaxID=2812678 RepID=UPI001E362AFB|nr:hypothetical protein [Pseudonocardia sp. TRM90224]